MAKRTARPNHLLRVARKERGWTQKDVADRIGAPLSLNVTRWEGGTSFPSAYYVAKLCQLFGKSASELGLIQEEYTVSPETSDETLPLKNPAFAPPPQPVHSFSRPKVVLLSGLVLLIILIGSGFLYMTYVIRNFAHSKPTPTHTVSAADAEATAHAAATATLVATYPDPYPPRGKLAFYDPLKAPYLWSKAAFPAQGTNCQFTQSDYHVSQAQVMRVATCWNNDFDLSNFAFEVQMTIVQGDCGGIISRTSSDGNEFYEFDVCQDGSYQFAIYTGATTNKTLVSKTSPAITIGLNQLNLIAIVANGKTFDLYVNKQKIDSIQDGTYSHGQVGLLASAFQNAPTEVAYSHAKAWTL
jgi:transcriptional regulator with XRE-family HTH domain